MKNQLPNENAVMTSPTSHQTVDEPAKRRTGALRYEDITDLPKPRTGSARVLCNCPACLNGWKEIARLLRGAGCLMKRNLPLVRVKRGPKQTDTLTLLMHLGFRSVGKGHWSDGNGTEIYELAGDEPYRLERNGSSASTYPSLIAVYHELKEKRRP